jgi:hypothetical protein
MKITLITLFTLLSLNTAYAQVFDVDSEVVEVLLEGTKEVTLEVNKDTFIPNVQGYACAVPAINLEPYHTRGRALNHNSRRGFMVKTFALVVGNPNMQFCGWSSATEVFGSEFVVGAKITLSITTKREIVHNTRNDGRVQKVLVETISSELNGIELISVARVSLGLD